MKLSLPSANSLLSALRAKLSSSRRHPEADLTHADPRALGGAHDRLTGLPGLISFEGTL